MSFIIEQLNLHHLQQCTPYSNPNNNKKMELNIPIYSMQKQRQNLLKSFGVLSNSVISTCIQLNSIIFNALVTHLFRNVSLIFKIMVNVKTQQLKFSFNLINNDNKFIILSGRQRRILFAKILVSRYYLTAFQEFKIAVKMETGEIQFFSPVFFISKNPQVTVGKIAYEIFKNFVENIKILYPSINLVKQLCNQSCKQFQSEYAKRGQNDKLNKNYYYSHLVNVYVNLTLDSTNQESSILLKQNKEIQSLKVIKNSYCEAKSLNGLELFTLVSHQAESREFIKKYQIDYSQRQMISERTALPPIPKAKGPENNYVLNFIKLNKSIDELQLRQISQGGFTDIFRAQVQYWYVGSYSGTLTQHSSNVPPLKKMIIVKREKNASIFDGKRNRIIHQKIILTKIKYGVSLFLPKYYINSDKDNNKQILSDYINYPTLGDYFLSNRETMSYQTKIYFGYMIAQSLRYLQQYNIVHLDLKPHNIMLSKSMMIKLIDFGESYHPEVNSYKPGFSNPYSAPQIYKSAIYTHKHDVFSLGVILYELFLFKFPFLIEDNQKRQRIYRFGSVNNYWYCCPEQNMNFGEAEIFPLIQLLIGKCISNQARERPQLQWIAFILRNCLDLLSLS